MLVSEPNVSTDWISTGDRLPAPETPVLAWSRYDGCLIASTYLVEAPPGVEAVYWAKYANSEITHWMPLPEAPE